MSLGCVGICETSLMENHKKSIKVWILQVGEPLPTDGPDVRLFRCGLLAQTLAEQGHQVRWWTSGFDHYKKCFRFASDEVIAYRPGYEIEALRGHGYAKNVSLDRYRDHGALGRKFELYAPQRERPDIIWCAFPIMELARPAVRYARQHGIPIILDAMDRWPDQFLEVGPRWLNPLFRLVLNDQWRGTREAFAGATAISGNSEGFVQWGLQYAGRQRNALDRPFYFGYPKPDLSPETRANAEAFWDSLGIVPGGPNLCFVGTVSDRPFDLTATVHAVQGLDEQVRYVICGEGESKVALQQLVGDDPRFVFAGWRNAAEIAVLMERCQIGIAPYRPTENFLHNIPNKIPEYLAGGLAVLSGVEGEMGAILHSSGAGMTYPASDPTALRVAIQALLKDPGKLQTMRAAASRIFESDFRADAVYSAIVETLVKIVHS